MIVFLRIFFLGIFVAMTWGTVRASLEQAMFDLPPEVTGNPWFQVTLMDAYFGFLTFYVWVAWKERRLAARVLWLFVMVLWGNFAMAIYMLRELFRQPADGELSAVFTTRHPGRLALPSVLLALGVVAYLLGAGIFAG